MHLFFFSMFITKIPAVKSDNSNAESLVTKPKLTIITTQLETFANFFCFIGIGKPHFVVVCTINSSYLAALDRLKWNAHQYSFSIVYLIRQ